MKSKVEMWYEAGRKARRDGRTVNVQPRCPKAKLGDAWIRGWHDEANMRPSIVRTDAEKHAWAMAKRRGMGLE